MAYSFVPIVWIQQLFYMISLNNWSCCRKAFLRLFVFSLGILHRREKDNTGTTPSSWKKLIEVDLSTKSKNNFGNLPNSLAPFPEATSAEPRNTIFDESEEDDLEETCDRDPLQIDLIEVGGKNGYPTEMPIEEIKVDIDGNLWINEENGTSIPEIFPGEISAVSIEEQEKSPFIKQNGLQSTSGYSMNTIIVNDGSLTYSDENVQHEGSSCEIIPIDVKSKIINQSKVPPRSAPQFAQIIPTSRSAVLRILSDDDDSMAEQQFQGQEDQGEGQLTCYLCQVAFARKWTLIRHNATKHGIPMPLENLKKIKNTKCCAKTIIKTGVQTIIKPGVQTIMKPGSSSRKIRQLRQFRPRAKDEKIERPFKCDICNERFILKHHRDGHVKTHTGERPFKCPICSKRFTQKYNLTGHLKIHTGRKRF